MAGPEEESALFFMLAHHDRHHLNRCLRVQFKNKKVFLCARCTGILTGFLTQAFFILTALNFDTSLGNVLLFLLPFPSVTDWITQSLGYRESINEVRVSTGFLLGLDFAYRLLRFLGEPLNLLVLSSMVLYLSAVFAVALISIRNGG